MKPRGISSGIRWCEVRHMEKPCFEILLDLLQVVGCIASIIAAIFAILAYRFTKTTYKENVRQERIRATLSDFPALRSKNTEFLSKVQAASPEERDPIIKKYVTQLERFAVGVNCGAYSLEIVNRMSGGLLVQQYQQIMKDFISRRREHVSHTKATHTKAKNVYKEYEDMMKALYEMRGLPWDD